MAESSRYRFGPLERRGLIAGWRGGQIAAVAVGLVVAVGVLRARPDLPGFLLATAAVLAGLAVACWRVGGSTLEQWAPVVLGWVTSGGLSGRARLCRAPVAGRVVSTGRVGAHDRRALASGSLDGCQLLAARPTAGSAGAGVVRDGRNRTYTAVLAVRGQAFALLEADEKQRRVSSWAGVLAGLARERPIVHRLQWVERSLPGDADALTSHLEEAAALDRGSAALSSYSDLVRAAGPVTQRHEIMLAVSVHAGQAARAVRTAGGGDEGACEVLLREVRSLESQLTASQLVVEGVLSPRALARTLRRAVESRPAPGSGERSGGDDRSVGWPWPMAGEVGWSNYRTDATWHSTYWISEWPRVEVGADFLAPVLLQAGARRTLSVVMEPVSPLRAVREVEKARTADAADAELRRRGGFMPTARRRREEELVARRETELADGHAQYRFSGYVTVTAGGTEELEVACGQVEQAAGQARLELRRMYGDQERAFSYTLPLGRGLV